MVLQGLGRMIVVGGSTKIDVKRMEMTATMTIGAHIVQVGIMDFTTVGKGWAEIRIKLVVHTRTIAKQ